MSALVDAIARRVTISHAVGCTVDELAAVRFANGTSPRSHADWLELIDERTSDVAATVLCGGEPDVDELVGLAADLQGLLETILRDAAA